MKTLILVLSTCIFLSCTDSTPTEHYYAKVRKENDVRFHTASCPERNRNRDEVLFNTEGEAIKAG
jgi:hypothetical protein